MSDANERPTCATCRFFKESTGMSGWCQRYPPALKDTICASNYAQPPLVLNLGWCGEHARIPYSAPDEGKWVIQKEDARG